MNGGANVAPSESQSDELLQLLGELGVSFPSAFVLEFGPDRAWAALDRWEQSTGEYRDAVRNPAGLVRSWAQAAKRVDGLRSYEASKVGLTGR